MKRLFSIFAIAAVMLLGISGPVNAKKITENVSEVGHTFSCKASKQDGGTEYGSLTFKVTQVGSTTTPGQVTLITFMSDWGDYSPSYWSGALYIPAYFTDPAGRKYVLTRIGDNVFQGGANISYIYFNYETEEMADYANKTYKFNIGNYSFAGCSKMTTISMYYGGGSRYHPSIYNIGKYAFQNCSSIVRSMISSLGGSIGEGAYENCSAMTQVDASGSINSTAFKGCTSVKLINWHGGYTTTLTSGSESPMYPMRNNVTDIYITGAVPAYFFYNFTALTKVISYTKFYDNLKNTNIYHMGVGEYGFGYCTSLQSIQVAGEINKYAFYGCSNLTSITYRGGYFAESQIPTSGGESFFNPVRSKITSFTIEETSTKTKPNTYIPAYICYGMSKLTKVTIPDYVKSIGDGAFSNCSALTTVSIDKTSSQISTIGEKAFYSCTALTSITLPVSLGYIYAEAFEWCESLKTCPITADHTKLRHIGKNAFYQAGLTSFYVPAGVTSLGTMLIGGSKCNVTTITYMPKNLSRNSIGGSWANLFIGTQDLYKSERNAVTKFRINSEMTNIPDSLCWNYTGLNYFYDNNDSKTLSSITKIGKATFAKCTGLFHSVTSQFPNLEEIGESAFEECGDSFILSRFPKVKKIGNKAFKNSKVYKMNQLGFVELTTIGDEAFAGCTNLEIIHIPSKVTKIGTDAFKNDTKVTELIWDAANYALEDPLESVRQNIETVTIGEDATTIPTQLLYQSKIKKLTIPEKVETVGYYSFASCTSLDSVIVLTNADKTSDNMPFTGNSKMKKVIYKGEATSIPDHMFSGAAVENIVWGNVNTIGEYAFENTAFKTLTFNNIQVIADNAFSGLSNLKEINISGEVPAITSKSFENTTGVTTIKASCTTIDVVKADANWKAVCANIQASDTKYTKSYLENLMGYNKTPYYEYWQWSYNCSIEIVNDLDCEGNVTLKCVPDEGYKFAYWRADGNKTNPRDFDLSKWDAWYLGGLCYNDANIYQTNFTVEPEGAGALKITNQYGHNRNDQKFLAINTDAEEAYLTPLESNGWYKFKEWKVDGMYSAMPYESYDNPGTYSMYLMVMENIGMGDEIDPETGMPIPSEPTYEPQFDPNMKAVFEIKDIDVTVENCSDENGTVEVSEVNTKVGSTVTLTATPKEGFMFDKWSDGSTDATRTLEIVPAILTEHRITGIDMESGDMLYDDFPVDMGGGSLEVYHSESSYFVQLCASFKVDPNYKKKYTITAEANDPDKGTVTGGGVYEEGSEATLTATAKTGFDFVQWNDEVTDNPRKVTVTGDATYTAEFVIHINYYDINTAADPEEGGTVIGGGNFAENTEITLTAVTYPGYEFVEWNDGVKDAVRTVKVTKNETYTAKFNALEKFFTITTAVTPEGSGSVTGGGKYAENATVTLNAIANEGYEFVEWNDGDKNATRTITVTADATYTATFKVQTEKYYTITTEVTPAGAGTVTGGGKYAENVIITLKATANSGYEFVKWSDGSTSASRDIKVTRDETYTAEFQVKVEKPKYVIVVKVDDPSHGSVKGGGTYEEGTIISIEATPAEGWKFLKWSDEVTSAKRQITVIQNDLFIAYFIEDKPDITYYNVSVVSSDPSKGSVMINPAEGPYAENSVVMIVAIPNEGFRFDQWNDGDQNIARSITVTGDAIYVANFKAIGEGLENIFETETDKARKVMIDGVIYIIKGDKMYNVLGAEVKM